jgi:hypothetical protein
MVKDRIARITRGGRLLVVGDDPSSSKGGCSREVEGEWALRRRRCLSVSEEES